MKCLAKSPHVIKGKNLTRKIALVGTSPTGENAPYDDQSWEIWGVSQRAEYVTRATRWFELHRIDGEPRHFQDEWRASMRAFLNNKTAYPIPLYMMYPETGITENIIQYPVDAMIARFGTYFMTSSFAWMMAMAIDELRPLSGNKNCGEIAIYGVEMEYGTEYRQQRVGFRHFIDLARVLDIPITRLAEGGLAYEPIPYPMWQDDPLLCKSMARHEDAVNQLKDLDDTIYHTRQGISATEGALNELGLQAESDYDKEQRTVVLEKQLSALLDSSAQTSKGIVQWQAIKGEHDWLQDYLAP